MKGNTQFPHEPVDGGDGVVEGDGDGEGVGGVGAAVVGDGVN